MQKQSSIYLELVEMVNEDVKNGRKPTHIFIDHLSFYDLLKDFEINYDRYWIPEEYSDRYKTVGLREVEFETDHGQVKVLSVEEKYSFRMIGKTKTYYDYTADKILLGN